jgi:hypothetical protein
MKKEKGEGGESRDTNNLWPRKAREESDRTGKEGREKGGKRRRAIRSVRNSGTL